MNVLAQRSLEASGTERQIENASASLLVLSAVAPFARVLALKLYGLSKKHLRPIERFRAHEQYVERIPALAGRYYCPLSALKEYFEAALIPASNWAQK